MTADKKTAFKKELHQLAIEIIRKRSAEAKQAMENAQAAANSEEKSSAGDKYETSRAMSQLEKDMHAKQLAANNQELSALLAINCEKLYDIVAIGSVVVCNELSFFIACGLGKISVGATDIYFLSPTAPVAKLLYNKVAGDTISFNNRQLTIQELY